jgi:hypothetical protein
MASYNMLTSKVQKMRPLQLNNEYINIPSFKADNSKYDSLFGKEVLK